MSVIPRNPSTDFTSTTLHGSINDSVQTITVNDASTIQTPTYAVIDREDNNGTATPNQREVVYVSAKAGNDLTVTRGVNNSTARSHNDSAKFEPLITVGFWSDFYTAYDNEHVVGDGSHDITKVAMLSGSTVQTLAGKILSSPTITLGSLSTTYINTATVTNLTIPTYLQASGASVVLGQFQTETPFNSMSRQAIINGNFDVAQRGTTSTNPSDNSFLLDRWRYRVGADGGTLPTTIIVSQQAQTPGDLFGSYYYYRINPNEAGASLGAGSYGTNENKIEHGTRMLCGNGKKVTVSFYARSSIANKKLAISLRQVYGTGGTPTSSETLNGTNFTLTSSWVKYSYTFTTNTLVGKTFGTANDDYLQLIIWHMWGTTWLTETGSAGAETYVGSGNIDIAQVQLCAGDVALPFQPKSFEEELRACQRYYWKTFPYEVAPVQNVGSYAGCISYTVVTTGTAGGTPSTTICFPTRMRKSDATLTFYSPGAATAKWYNRGASAESGAAATPYSVVNQWGFNVYNTQVAGDSAGHTIYVHATADAEL